MAEYVERYAVLELLEERQKELCPVGMYRRNAVYGSDREKFDEWQDLIDAVKAIPDSDVAPVRHGKWGTEIHGIERSVCSECGAVFEGGPFNYCAKCGAKMDREG